MSCIAPILDHDELDDFDCLGAWDGVTPPTSPSGGLFSGLSWRNVVALKDAIVDIAPEVPALLPSIDQVSDAGERLGTNVAQQAPTVIKELPSTLRSAAYSMADDVRDSVRVFSKWTPYVLAGLGALVLWRILR